MLQSLLTTFAFLIAILTQCVESLRFQGLNSNRYRNSIKIQSNSLVYDLPTSIGDVTTIELSILSADSKNRINTSFDQGEITFCSNGPAGFNIFFPEIHDIVNKLTINQHVSERINGPKKDENLILVFSKDVAPDLKENDIVKLSNGLKATVTKVTSTDVTIDANPIYSGEQYIADIRLIDRQPLSLLERCTFAAGCFWGLELAFQRMNGVVYTAVGYTHGSTENPTYQEVCSGKTGHAEAVTVLYNPKQVTFTELLETFWNRHNPTQLNYQGNDRGTQYRGGIYYHHDSHLEMILKSLKNEQLKYSSPIVTEIKQSTKFWLAEEYHQQYLEKGGQSAKKDSDEKIRCYG